MAALSRFSENVLEEELNPLIQNARKYGLKGKKKKRI